MGDSFFNGFHQIEGWPFLYYDEVFGETMIRTPDDDLLITVQGNKSVEQAKRIAKLYYPETPADVKTIY